VVLFDHLFVHLLLQENRYFSSHFFYLFTFYTLVSFLHRFFLFSRCQILASLLKLNAMDFIFHFFLLDREILLMFHKILFHLS
jgi:hypothetical protein